MNKIILIMILFFVPTISFAASIVGGRIQPDCTINPVSMTNYIEKRIVLVDKNVVDSFVVPNHLLFDNDKSVIRADGITALQQLLSSVAPDKLIAITITGNTDSNGSDEYNTALGQRRADAVKAVFVKMKISADVISTKSQGESAPIDSNATAVGRQKNRRVEITVKHTVTNQVEEIRTVKRAKDVQVFTAVPSGTNSQCVYDEDTMPSSRPNWRRF